MTDNNIQFCLSSRRELQWRNGRSETRLLKAYGIACGRLCVIHTYRGLLLANSIILNMAYSRAIS